MREWFWHSNYNFFYYYNAGFIFSCLFCSCSCFCFCFFLVIYYLVGTYEGLMRGLEGHSALQSMKYNLFFLLNRSYSKLLFWIAPFKFFLFFTSTNVSFYIQFILLFAGSKTLISKFGE